MANWRGSRAGNSARRILCKFLCHRAQALVESAAGTAFGEVLADLIQYLGAQLPPPECVGASPDLGAGDAPVRRFKGIFAPEPQGQGTTRGRDGDDGACGPHEPSALPAHSQPVC